MAIQTVQANINGTWHTLTYNDDNGRWEATITAPGATSFNQPGGYYNVQIKATNTAGTEGTADGSADNGGSADAADGGDATGSADGSADNAAGDQPAEGGDSANQQPAEAA